MVLAKKGGERRAWGLIVLHFCLGSLRFVREWRFSDEGIVPLYIEIIYI